MSCWSVYCIILLFNVSRYNLLSWIIPWPLFRYPLTPKPRMSDEVCIFWKTEYLAPSNSSPPIWSTTQSYNISAMPTLLHLLRHLNYVIAPFLTWPGKPEIRWTLEITPSSSVVTAVISIILGVE